MSESLCELLPWDSAFFGHPIARIRSGPLGTSELEKIRRWAEAESVDCLYYLVEASDADSIAMVEDAGFRLTDVRVTRAGDPRQIGPGSAADSDIGPVRPEEVEALKSLARVSHRDTRFFRDPHFPDERCEELYATWIARSCAAPDDRVLVARRDGEPFGYLASRIEASSDGRVDLVAVSRDARGQRVGEQLARASSAWLRERGCSRVSVTSHAGNVPAARLWERLGFLTTSVQHTYHWWPAESPA